jgi:hypothetical protein
MVVEVFALLIAAAGIVVTVSGLAAWHARSEAKRDGSP